MFWFFNTEFHFQYLCVQIPIGDASKLVVLNFLLISFQNLLLVKIISQ